MPKVPRDISAKELIDALQRLGYYVERQKGSHIRLGCKYKGGIHKLTVPAHSPLKIGTLNAILRDIAEAHGMSKSDLIKKLFYPT